MFGADTPLVMDALQLAGIAAVVSAAAVFLTMRRFRKAAAGPEVKTGKPELEERVAVLERIATDSSIGLADEIEALRDRPEQEKAAQ